MAEVPVARTGPTRAIFDRPSTPMLNAIGRICLALARHLKSGGVIVNEHVLDREQTRRHVDVLSRCFDFIHLNDLPRQLYRRGKKDRKSTRLNSSHGYISYAVFCLKKKK